MKIYHSTEYIDESKQKESWYQLVVVNQWNFLTKISVYKDKGKEKIYYVLKKYSSNDTWIFTETIDILTDEMKQELIKMGYSLYKINGENNL